MMSQLKDNINELKGQLIKFNSNESRWLFEFKENRCISKECLDNLIVCLNNIYDSAITVYNTPCTDEDYARRIISNVLRPLIENIWDSGTIGWSSLFETIGKEYEENFRLLGFKVKKESTESVIFECSLEDLDGFAKHFKEIIEKCKDLI